MDRPPVGDVEDLATLAKLDEHILLAEIKERYSKNKIYTYVGDILIAVNPYKELEIYGKDASSRYRNCHQSSNPPHIFAVADAAYQALVGLRGRQPGNQCILISGESGAGKTESTKLIIKQIVELCRGNTQLERQLLQVNPLLEAFGNAQTVMNDNSSRFGKYIQLRFHKGHLVGGKISEYLLEKSRVVRQNIGEENFHIFSYLFAGTQIADPDGHFALNNPSQYRYMSDGAPNFRKHFAMLQRQFEDLVVAMDMVGFTDDEQHDMFTVIAAILHLGNVSFELDDFDAAMVTNTNGAIKVASKLLGLNTEDIVSCLTSVITVTKGEIVKRNYSLYQAEDARDAMAKTVYGRLFGWIVNKINQLLAPEIDLDPSETSEIGILDIFGFENFEKNSFEQACINLANEQLQFFFNQHIFRMEQEVYVKEGIDWTEITFVDNKPLLDLFLAKPIGLLALLDEESHFPKATELSYVEKMNANFKKNQHYVTSPQTKKPVFSIVHYAGKVTYDASEWLEKNRDTFPAGIMEILQASSNTLVKTIFRGHITRTGTLALQGKRSTSRTLKNRRAQITSTAGEGAKRKITVGAQFKSSLAILMERMTSATPSFVRCLKPNYKKQSDLFDDKFIQAQLLYTGMLETTKIRREGFAVRPAFEEFVYRYKILLCRLDLEGNKQNCIKILQASRMTGWQVGKTKVFLKYWHMEKLSELLDQFGKKAVVIQKVVRGFLGRRYYARLVEQASRQRERVEAFLRAVERENVAKAAILNQLVEHDKAKPKEVVNGVMLPTIPVFQNDSVKPLPQEYLAPKTSTTTTGTQMDDDSSDSEFLEDDFKPSASNLNKFGQPDTKRAATLWFKETQTNFVLDSTSGRFAEWFHGIISRSESESLLKNKIIGCFLIRVSESRFGYTLSFKDKDRCRHYMIDQLKNGKFVIIGEKKVHRSLHTLIQHHRKVKISNWDGLLTVPCGQVQGQCNYIDLVDKEQYFILEEESGINLYLKAKSSSTEQPELPPRNYSVQNRDVSQASPVGHLQGRPLPRVPESSYNRLLQNQTNQHRYDPLTNQPGQKTASAPKGGNEGIRR